MRACAGIKVLEVGGRFGVSALTGQLFTGLGATVRLARTRDSGARADETADYGARLLHHGKTIEAFESGDAAGPALDAMIEWADVVLADGEAAGDFPILCRPADFEARWPGKIFCLASLFGRDSSRSGWTGNELVAEAAGALMACNGYPELPPVASGLPYAIHTASLFAFNGVMTALWECGQSRLGQVLDLSVVDCITAVLGNFLPSYFLSGKSPRRIGNRHTIAAPWNIYPAADGTVVICTGTGGTGWWKKVTDVIGRPELADDPLYATEADRVRNVDSVDAIMAGWTGQRTMLDIVEQMNARAIPAGEISTIEAVLDDPHYRALRQMVVAGTAQGDLPLAGIPLKVGRWHDQPSAAEPLPRSAAARGRVRGGGRAGPLSGIRVVEFASRTSVPLAGRLMADFGADIIKVEPPKGDALRGAGQQLGGSSYLFHINNAGKRSVVIDPACPEGRDLILDLVRHADVFIENLAPGSVEAMGLGPAVMQSVNPGLVYCSVSGFGARSGYGSKRALDTVVQAACGLMYVTGYPDHYPVKLGISAVDLTTATAAMAAVLAGLRERQATSIGPVIDLAMADVGVWMTQSTWPALLCDGQHPVRLGNRSATACPHDTYPTRDGGMLAIAVETAAQWRALVTLLGDPSLESAVLADPSARMSQRELIDAAIGAWASGTSAEAGAEAAQALGIPAAPVRDLVSLVADPDVAGRHMIVELDHPTAGSIRLLGNPACLSRTPPVIRGVAPDLGAHTREVLADWLDLSAETLAALHEQGVIAGPGIGTKRPVREPASTHGEG